MTRNLKRISNIVVGIALSVAALAQDIHYSQYNYSPLNLNPALAGLNNCDYRVAINARTQWNAVSGGNTYSTGGASFDVAVGKPTKFSSFAGVGVAFNTDVAGATNYNSNSAKFSAAYHFTLDRRANSSISIGLEVGVNHRGLWKTGTYDSQYDEINQRYNAGLDNGEKLQRNHLVYIDAGVGALFSKSFKQKRNNIYVGIAVSHVNQPNISFYSRGVFNDESKDRLYAKTTIHGGGMFMLSSNFWIMPNFMLLIQGPAQQYNFGALFRMKIGNNISKTYFYLGGQYRAPFDAFILQARLDYKKVLIGFSYDVNLSKLAPASLTLGGPELAIILTGCINTDAKRRKQPFLCPPM
jgi:hypothetical protein